MSEEKLEGGMMPKIEKLHKMMIFSESRFVIYQDDSADPDDAVCMYSNVIARENALLAALREMVTSFPGYPVTDDAKSVVHQIEETR